MKPILFKLMVAAIALSIMPTGDVFAATQTGPLQIVKIHDPQSGNVGMLIKVTGTMVSDGCAGGYYALSGSNPNYKTQSAMVMAAYLSGKPIDMYVAGTSSGFSCTFGFPTIIWFNIDS